MNLIDTSVDEFAKFAPFREEFERDKRVGRSGAFWKQWFLDYDAVAAAPRIDTPEMRELLERLHKNIFRFERVKQLESKLRCAASLYRDVQRARFLVHGNGDAQRVAVGYLGVWCGMSDGGPNDVQVRSGPWSEVESAPVI